MVWSSGGTVHPSPETLVLRHDPAFSVPFEDRLGPLWGPIPHRISHKTAMALAPAPIKAGFLLHVCGPAVPSEAAGRLKVRAYEESEDTLLVGARLKQGATWISEPGRALLECLKDEDNVVDGDYAAALVLHASSGGPPLRVLELAERLGWGKPLRRLASIATLMDNCRGVFGPRDIGLLPESQQPLLSVTPPPRDAEWISLLPYRIPGLSGVPEFIDDKYRVLWWEHPHDFMEHLLW